MNCTNVPAEAPVRIDRTLIVIAAMAAPVAGLVAGGVAAGLAQADLLLPVLLAGVVAAVACTRLDFALAIYIFVVFTEASDVIYRRTDVPLLAEAVVGLLLVATIVDRRVTRLPVSGIPKVLLLFGPFMLYSLTTYFWAEVPSLVLERFSSQIRMVLVAVVVVAAVRSFATLRLIAWAIIAGAVFLATASLAQLMTRSAGPDFFFGFASTHLQGLDEGSYAFRLSGPILDPNFFAQRLVIALPFALERMMSERHLAARAAATAALPIILLAIALTYSRGGFLAISAVVVAWLFRWFRARTALLLCTLAVAGLLVVAPDAYVGRVLSMADVVSVDSNTEGSIRGRVSEAIVGYEMFRDHPLLGVGSAQYPLHYATYAPGVGLDTSLLRAPHSLYLEVAAEGGGIGLVLFSLICVGAFIASRRAMRELESHDRWAEANLIWALRLAVVAYLTAALFLHLAHGRIFFILVGLCIAAPYLVRQVPSMPPGKPTDQAGAADGDAAPDRDGVGAWTS